MKKYLVVYKAPAEEFQKMMANASKEDRKKGMEEWGAWMKKHESEFADPGAPVGKTKEVMAGGVKDVKNDIGGYSIVQAQSHKAATKIFADSPHLRVPRASIEVMEVVEMPGM